MGADYSKLADELIRDDIVDGSKDSWLANGRYTASYEQMRVALMIDMASSLRRILRTLDCPNTLEIPAILRSIRRNTAKPRKRTVKP